MNQARTMHRRRYRVSLSMTKENDWQARTDLETWLRRPVRFRYIGVSPSMFRFIFFIPTVSHWSSLTRITSPKLPWRHSCVLMMYSNILVIFVAFVFLLFYFFWLLDDTATRNASAAVVLCDTDEMSVRQIIWQWNETSVSKRSTTIGNTRRYNTALSY